MKRILQIAAAPAGLVAYYADTRTGAYHNSRPVYLIALCEDTEHPGDPLSLEYVVARRDDGALMLAREITSYDLHTPIYFDKVVREDEP
jgi:hypothetical protein